MKASTLSCCARGLGLPTAELDELAELGAQGPRHLASTQVWGRLQSSCTSQPPAVLAQLLYIFPIPAVAAALGEGPIGCAPTTRRCT